MDFNGLTQNEIAALERFLIEGQEMEMAQARDLIENCDNKYQFAKTHSVYVRDMEKMRAATLDKLEWGNLPPGFSEKFTRNMLEIYEGIVNQKLELVRAAFSEKFGESIYNYLGKDGKTKGFFSGIFTDRW